MEVKKALTAVAAMTRLKALAADKARHNIPGRLVFAALAAGAGLLLLGLCAAAGLWGGELALGGAAGVAWGALLAGIYHLNRKRKAARNERLAMVPGQKGMQMLLHHIPTWISFRETEKVEWLNKVLEKVWPYYDRAVCAAVKEVVEPLLNAYKPPGLVKSIYFAKLSMGDRPFRVEGIRVDKDITDDQLEIEVDYRWSSDASIFLAIELPAGGQATRMVPKVSDLAVSGTLRVVLRPLLPEIPGFGAATVALMRPPVVRFHLDFGRAFGGSLAAGRVKAWLDPFLRTMTSQMLLWPKRIVVPLLPEEVTGSLQDLYLQHRGVLELEVVEAKVPKMDSGLMGGKADPFVVAYTTEPAESSRTSTQRNTLTPRWNERLWLLVQEPEHQAAYIAVNDWDRVDATELLRLNVLKGASNLFGAENLIGRYKLHIKELADSPGQPRDSWHPLGLGTFEDEDGCGGGQGEVRLRATYWPFDLLGRHTFTSASVGAAVVTLISAANLPVGDDPLGTSDPFVEFKCNGEERESSVVYQNLNPKWAGEMFTFYRVPIDEVLKVKVCDWDRWTSNETLGKTQIALRDVAEAPGGVVTRAWALEGGLCKPAGPDDDLASQPSVTLQVRWIPFTKLG